MQNWRVWSRVPGSSAASTLSERAIVVQGGAYVETSKALAEVAAPYLGVF